MKPFSAGLVLTASVALAGCEQPPSEATDVGITSHMLEGDDVGECSNGADDDGNGFFDCDDQGCFGSPDCQGGGTATGGPTGGTNTTTTTTGTNPNGALGDLTAATITLGMLFDSALNGLGVCDCYIEFNSYATATGVVDDSNATLGTRVEFQGPWTIAPFQTTTGTTTTTTTTGNPFGNCSDGYIVQCDPAELALWPGSDPAYHDFFFDTFSDPPTAVKHWVVHEFPGAYIPSTSPSAARQFFITDMWAPYDHSFPVITYQTVESYPLLFDAVITQFDVVFEK